MFKKFHFHKIFSRFSDTAASVGVNLLIVTKKFVYLYYTKPVIWYHWKLEDGEEGEEWDFFVASYDFLPNPNSGQIGLELTHRTEPIGFENYFEFRRNTQANVLGNVLPGEIKYNLTHQLVSTKPIYYENLKGMTDLKVFIKASSWINDERKLKKINIQT